MNIVLVNTFDGKGIKIKRVSEKFDIIYVYLGKDLIVNNNIFSKYVIYAKMKYVKLLFSKYFKELNDNVYIVSKNIDNDSRYTDVLSSILDDRFKEVLTPNTIHSNCYKYLEKYDNNKKILCIMSKKIDIKIILQLINKFKHVDILYNGIDNEYINRIKSINTEYGSTISLMNTNDLTVYDVYVLFDTIDCNKFLLSKKVKWVDLTYSDDDVYSKEYKVYNKYSRYIENKRDYSKTRLGRLLDIYLSYKED